MKTYKGYTIPEGAAGFIAGHGKNKITGVRFDAFYKNENGKTLIIAADDGVDWYDGVDLSDVNIEPLPVEPTVIRYQGCDYIQGALYYDSDKDVVRLVSVSDAGLIVQPSNEHEYTVTKLNIIPFELGTITPVDIDSEIKRIIGTPGASADDQVEAIKGLFQ